MVYAALPAMILRIGKLLLLGSLSTGTGMPICRNLVARSRFTCAGTGGGERHGLPLHCLSWGYLEFVQKLGYEAPGIYSWAGLAILIFRVFLKEHSVMTHVG